jgi:protein-L-isoaspartate(D-aspartate) O-methyltransferase
MDVLQARKNTIEQQVRPWGGLNNSVNDALLQTHRENFVPEKYINLAFADFEIPLSSDAKMLSPKLEGRMLDAVNIQKDESVLQIGTGSGYITAVISQLCKSVTTLEINQDLSNAAQKRVLGLGINHVKFINIDARDWQPDNFFGVVVVEASVPKISSNYMHLLSVGGRMFIVEGEDNAMTAKLITRTSEDKWTTKSLFETHIDPLIGSQLKQEFEF